MTVPFSRAIFGCAGLELLPEERDFFRQVRPWGFILFGRNVSDPEQVKRLVAALRETVDAPNAPVLIDQEGGRVRPISRAGVPARPAAFDLISQEGARRCSSA